MKPKKRKRDLYFLKLLSRSFPNVATASTEIINLEAILNLPKGTEHFLADLHGEYLAFQHVLRNASGTIKRKVGEIFNDSLSTREQKDLCTLIYYPAEKLELVKAAIPDKDELNDWYFITINRLVKVCRNVSSKYSRSKVHKALPEDFSYIIQELMHEHSSDPNKQAYVDVIIKTIISTHRVDEFIIAVCNLIQQLTIDMLHILGDVYDRGPSPDKIMDVLGSFHNFDIQWGNHDILWMGAAAGNDCSIANVLRIALRYGNHGVLEDGYGINLLPLATFAMDTYANDPCERFLPKDGSAKDPERARTAQLVAQMHKAISIIQFKLEAAAIKRRPDFDMKDRLLLDKMDLQKGIIKIKGKEYEMLDTNFPTVDPKHPYKLTPEEESIVNKLHQSFTESDKLRKHMKCMFRNGCLYTIANGNLLYHASIPLNEDGTLKDVLIRGEKYHGKALLKRAGNLIRSAYFGCEDPDEYAFALDYLWYLWCGKDSPAFDKSKMATFERYFIADKDTHKEVKGAYYTMRDNPEVVDMILDEFGVEGEHRHIINGHVPVKTIKGENPIKAGGKLMVIDGGFSKAYQPETGIAGYTLVYHSRGFELVQHGPFSSKEEAVNQGQDIKSTRSLVELTNHRMHVKDTDIGIELQSQIDDLKELLDAYRSGDLKERNLRPITNKR
ncbi:MAG: fructose-1,6-bisphosphatase [Muribaculaceae bacterium]|nr:fructose-1,6-bisphosphatase [Muribaculaceae bacterium]